MKTLRKLLIAIMFLVGVQAYASPTNDYNELILKQIEINTYEDFWQSGVTCIAVLGLVVAVVTFIFQLKTERHTKNVSVKSQKGVLTDLPRHFYRNLVCTVAMLIKYRHKLNKGVTTYLAYPSEANVMKLQTLPEEFILSIDTSSNNVFDVMHEQKLLFKNYNIEVAVASEHFSRPKITEESLINDFDNLLFKPVALVKDLFKLNHALDNMKWCGDVIDEDTYVSNVICTFVKTHLSKLDFGKIKTEFQWKCIEEINETANFEAYLESQKTSVEGYSKTAIGRSLESLMKLGSGKYDNRDEDKIVKFKKFFVREGKKFYINRKEFVDYFFDVYLRDSEKSKFMLLRELTEKTGDKKNKNNNAALSKYFDFWANDKWDVLDLLYNMLKIDAVCELPVIGMIQHDGKSGNNEKKE